MKAKLAVWLLLFSILVALPVFCFGKGGAGGKGSGGGKAVAVKGYTKADGTYVAPHLRSAPDGNFNNNWSTKGNVNPYTGEAGRKVTAPSGSGGSLPSYSSGNISSQPEKRITPSTSSSQPHPGEIPSPTVPPSGYGWKQPDGKQMISIRQLPNGTRITNVFHAK